MYTDGVTEARDALGRFLPLLDVVRRLATAPFDEALDELLAEIRKHVPHGDLGDDLAVVLLENAPSGAQSAVEIPSS
jgi:serine phosphatase RsbU (regulator of sigma subunit)